MTARGWTILALTLVLGMACCTHEAIALRVRKSIMNLSDEEFKMYVQGCATMMSVNTAQGQKLFGPKYRDIEYFVVKHAVSAYTPVKDLNPGAGPASERNCFSPANNSVTAVYMAPGTCDVAHDGPWFMTFHVAFMKEFENSLLSVVPDLLALPYWEMYEEFKGTPGNQGKYYKSPKGLLTADRFGTIPGDEKNEWQVKDGIFMDRMIPTFTPSVCTSKGYPACDAYNGSRAGLLRQFDNNLTQPRIIRFPYWALSQIPSRAYLSAGLEMNFTRKDFARCTDTKVVKNVWNYVNCVDIYSTQVAGVDKQGFSFSNPLYTNGTNGFIETSIYHHALYHNTIGSFMPGSAGHDLPFGLLGDVRTTSTSPNEPYLFFLFHENMMRGFLIWKKKIAEEDPSQALPDVMWGYPKQASLVPPITRQGTGLDDVVSPRMPFKDLWPGIQSKGVTHRDVLNWKPDYEYDVNEIN